MFVGRKEYLTDLETLWRKRTSSIIACRGRRRIGKSALFGEFARRTADAYIEIEGLPPSAETVMVGKWQILECLGDGLLTGAELAEKLGRGRNGRFAEYHKELTLRGFITSDPGRNPATGGAMRISKYRLFDNYTRFYLKYIQPHRIEIEYGSCRYESLEHLPNWNIVMGLQFENLIVNNAMSFVPFLGVGHSTVDSAAPYRNARKTRKGDDRGCQVALLIQTPKAAYVAEVKRRNLIEPTIEDEMRKKLSRLPMSLGVSVRPVLVYAGERAKSVEVDGYFDAEIPVRKLLGL